MRRLYTCLLLAAFCLCASAHYFPCRRINTLTGLSDNHVQYVMRLPDGRTAITTWAGINLYDGSHFTLPRRNTLSQHPLPGHVGTFSVAVDGANRIWVKRWGELWCLDLERGTYITHFDSLFAALVPDCKGRPVDNVFVDEDHGLWLLQGHTLHDVRRGQSIALPHGFARPTDLVVSGGRLWLFTDDGRWVRYSGKPWHKEATSTTPLADSTEAYWDCITRSGPDGAIWQLHCGHESRIVRLDPTTDRHATMLRRPYLLGTFTLRPTRGGTELWAGSRHGIIVRDVNGQEVEFHQFAVQNGIELSDLHVSNIYFDPDGDLWLSTNGHGVLYNHSCPYAMTTADDHSQLGIPDSVFWQLRHRRNEQLSDPIHHPSNDELTDRYGRQWKALTYGLAVGTKDGQRLLTTADGLAGDYVQALAEDSHGTVWAATSQGISSVSLDLSDGCLRIVNYDAHDGCLTSEYLPRSGASLPDGRICFQGLGGWTAFHPDSVPKPRAKLAPRLVNIYVNSARLTTSIHQDGVKLDSAPSYAHNITLDYDHNSIELDFSAFTYAHPLQTFYRWRLASGRDTPWQTADHHSTPQLVDAQGALHLSMLKLAPGRYHVEVMASTDGFDFGGSTTRFDIRILPPWWQTWWAYTIYIICVLAVAGAFVWLYVRHQRREMEWRRMEEVLQLKIQHMMQESARPDEEAAPDEADSTTAPTEADTPQPATLSARDEEFLQRAVDCIERHLGEDYSVTQLAADLCMERTGLYKRLTAIIDESPQLFIRGIRLHRAAELLTTTDQSVADIAYAVGFSSASYLVKCFREKYGCTPGEWRERK